MKGYLKRLAVALGECAVIFVVMSSLYVLSYLLFNQEFPRWK